MPPHAMARDEGVQLAPQVLVLHRLAVGGLPAPALPAGHPFGDALLHVLGVGVHLYRHLPIEQRPFSPCIHGAYGIVTLKGAPLSRSAEAFTEILKSRLEAQGST